MSQEITLLRIPASINPFDNLSPQNGLVKQYKELCGWRRIFYSKSVFDKKLQELYKACVVESHLKQNLLEQYSDPLKKRLVARHFEKILFQACFNAGLDPNSPSVFLEADKVRKLFTELKEIIVAIEPKGIKVYPTKNMQTQDNLHNLVKYLLYDIPFSGEMITLKNIKAALIKKNPNLINQVKQEFHSIFKSIFEQRKGHDDFILEMLIGNLLSLFTYFKPKKGEKIQIPQKIGGSWQLIEFKIEKIRLTPKILGSPVYAFGLKPVNPKKGSPLLIFKGTTFPQDNGFLTSIIADFTPLHSVGGGLYDFGKEEIGKWIKNTYESHNKTPIKIYGQSLGGALTYHAALDHPEMVEIQAYVPPGLIREKKENIHGKIFCHENDFINALGYHPKDADLYKIITSADRNKFTAHLRVYGCEDAIVLKVNRARENLRFSRTFLNILHQIGSIFIYFFVAIVRLYFALRYHFHKMFKHYFGRKNPPLTPN